MNSGTVGPNFPVVAIGRSILRRGLVQAWRDLLTDVGQRYSGSGNLFGYLDVWNGAARMCGRADCTEWFGEPTSLGVAYLGPPVVIKHGALDSAPIEWTVEVGGGALEEPLAGLFLVVQSIATTLSNAPMRGVSFDIELDGPLPYPKDLPCWLDHKNALHRWQLVETSTKLLKAASFDVVTQVQRWRTANWITILCDASMM